MPLSRNGLTERQQKWFASLREGLARDTGRSLEDWVEIARACPETKPRARQRWLKDNYGVGQNRAIQIFNAAFPPDAAARAPETLEAALWSDAAARAVFEAARAAALRLPEVVVGQRRGFTAFSRQTQFAALRPDKAGGAVLGLALPADASPRLGPVKREAWSERLQSCLRLDSPTIDLQLEALLKAAWERSG
jgi:hypothetical protein